MEGLSDHFGRRKAQRRKSRKGSRDGHRRSMPGGQRKARKAPGREGNVMEAHREVAGAGGELYQGRRRGHEERMGEPTALRLTTNATTNAATARHGSLFRYRRGNMCYMRAQARATAIYNQLAPGVNRLATAEMVCCHIWW